MSKRKGLPGELERETYNSLRDIFLKYLAMKKKPMGRDRIAGIMYGAFINATSAKEDQPSDYK